MDSAERAARAVREFRHMVPGLSSYAQTITGNPKLRVRAHPITSTDGTWVNIRPPLALADKSDHDRRLCDKRDEIGTLLCPACQRSEAVYSCLYHEMSHIVSGSLDKRQYGYLKNAVMRGLAGAPDSTKKYIESRLATRGRTGGTIYEFADEIHPYLVGVLRATDDYVIESRAIAARPGVEEMLYYSQEQIMLLGMENGDEPNAKWSEQPTEVQLPIALLIELHGWGLENKFSDEAIAVIRSDGIQALVERDVPDVLTGLAAAVGFLGEFNRLGYLLAEDQEQEKEQGDEQESEDSESGDDDSDEDTQSDGEGDGEDYDTPGQPDDENDSGNGAADDSDKGNGGEKDDADEPAGGSASDDSVQPDNGPGDVASDGDDAADGVDGDLSDKPDDSSGSDDEKDDQQNESDEVNDDDAQGDSEPGDSDSSSGAGSDVDGPDSGSDVGDSDGSDQGDSGTATDSGGSTVDSAADADAGAGNPSNGRATPEEIDKAMSQATGHEQNEQLMDEGYEHAGEPTHDGEAEDSADYGGVSREDLEIAIIQALHFDDISRTVGKVEIFRGDEGNAMGFSRNWSPVEESVIAGTINRARRVFTDNELDKHVNNLKSGKLSARSLGARGWGDDRRVFRKKLRADKDDYFVVIGMDVSGSTMGGEINRIKRAGNAMADLLHRLGVPFAIYAHSTSYWHETIDQHIYELKGPDDQWDKSARARLGNLTSDMGSLDGHNFEFYRKVAMRSDATKKICVYYTDGCIPETNHVDESVIMEREAKLYRRLGIESLIVAVGIELPDPYGFDQVHLDDDADISKVLGALEKKLTKGKTYA